MTWTVLRPSFFMETWFSPALGFDVAAGTARIYGAGLEPISWVTRDDVAEFVAEAVDSEEARNATLEIGGPEALSPLDAVKVVEAVAGRKLQLDHVGEDILRARLAAAVDAGERSLTALMLAYARGNAIPMKDMAERFGLELTSLRSWAEGSLAAENDSRRGDQPGVSRP
jgi:uncharacterized protein YbjT (DUF2867 family)